MARMNIYAERYLKGTNSSNVLVSYDDHDFYLQGWDPVIATLRFNHHYPCSRVSIGYWPMQRQPTYYLNKTCQSVSHSDHD